MSTHTSLPHQRVILDLLVGACPTQHGLLVAHQMGAGKTLTALMFLRNYPRSPKIIICPSPPFDRSIYDRQHQHHFGKPLGPKVRVIDFDELVAVMKNERGIFQDAIVIIDEAHYLIPFFNRLDTQLYELYYKVLQKSTKKVLLLTGTPVYNAVTDLRVLVNISAGKDVMPFRETEYINKFTSPNVIKRAIFGYILPIFTSWQYATALSLYTGVSMFHLYRYLGGDGKLPPKAQKFIEKGEKELKDLNAMGEPYMKEVNDAEHEYDKNFEWIRSGHGTFEQQKIGTDAEVADTYRKWQVKKKELEDFQKREVNPKKRMWDKKYLPTLKWKNSGNIGVETIPDQVNNFLYAIIPREHQASFQDMKYHEVKIAGVLATLVQVLMIYGSMSLNGYMLKLFTKDHDAMFYRRWDDKKLKAALSPYVSYYKLTPGSHGVPTSTQTEVAIMYTAYQTGMWTRMVYNFLTQQDLRDLGITEKDLSYDQESSISKSITLEHYHQWGRMLSNLYPPTGPFPPKFEKCFDNMCKGSPTKLPRRCVVYSDFKKGTYGFCNFLKHKSTKGAAFSFDILRHDLPYETKRSMLENFKNGTLDVIILHAGMYEGVSFHKTAQFHILDPPQEYKNMAQLMGRVVRLDSHEGLSKEDKRVEYYHYIAYFSPSYMKITGNATWSLSNKFSFFKEYHKLWVQTQAYKQKVPTVFKPTIAESITPEARTASKLRPLRELMVSLEKNVQGALVVPAMRCCPKYEADEIKNEECVSRNLPPCDDTA